MDKCQVCGTKVEIAIFRGAGYCSDDHRKVLSGENPWPALTSGVTFSENNVNYEKN